MGIEPQNVTMSDVALAAQASDLHRPWLECQLHTLPRSSMTPVSRPDASSS